MVHAYNPSTQEDQEFQAALSYIVRHCLKSLKKKKKSQALVAHPCNPNYSGGSDLEDHSSKPAWANSSSDLILKIPNKKKKGWWSGSSGTVPASKSSTTKKPQFFKKKRKRVQD
jgi:hypothetical protein